MQNVINLAFESAGSLAASVETLDAFQTLAKRDAIVKCVERKTSEVSRGGGVKLTRIFLCSWR
jgi:dynein heavy chain